MMEIHMHQERIVRTRWDSDGQCDRVSLILSEKTKSKATDEPRSGVLANGNE